MLKQLKEATKGITAAIKYRLAWRAYKAERRRFERKLVDSGWSPAKARRASVELFNVVNQVKR